MILDEIVAFKKIEVKERKEEIPFRKLERLIAGQDLPRAFLKKSEKIQLIAELKKASPLKGVIRKDFEPVKLAKDCAAAGASALSVLTDEKFFQGSLIYLSSVRENVALPVLRKDFIIDEYQILESRAYGADAVLLIANILKHNQIKKLLSLSEELGLKVLTEVFTADQIKMVLDAEARIIGINNRDLKTFEVDIKNTKRLLPFIPKEKIIVSESGIFTKEDRESLEDLGIDAVLIGGVIMSAADVGIKIKELIGL